MAVAFAGFWSSDVVDCLDEPTVLDRVDPVGLGEGPSPPSPECWIAFGSRLRRIEFGRFCDIGSDCLGATELFSIAD